LEGVKGNGDIVYAEGILLLLLLLLSLHLPSLSLLKRESVVYWYSI
jgi:hypothetical protein